MVAKKHKSKRQHAYQRYKVEKRVREHQRKSRKEARENPQHKRKFKDPGIPKSWPHREQLLQEAQDYQRRAEEAKTRQKQDRASKIQKNRQSLDTLITNAERRQQDFNQQQSMNNGADSFSVGYEKDDAVHGRKDNSVKAYYREFRQVVENADVILEVLDARDPLGCRCKQVEQLIREQYPSKRIVLVLNKVDLIPREVAQTWLDYLRKELPCVAFKASTQSQRDHLGQSSLKSQTSMKLLQGSSECLGAEQLMSLLKNYSRQAQIKTALTVGIIGFPNVGKSSLINSLRRARVCSVGSTPGLTKNIQEIALDKNVRLLDCPGIVFSRAEDEERAVEAVLRNCIKVELLEDPISPVEIILKRCKSEQLTRIYNIPMYAGLEDFLVQVARQKGRLRKGGVPDIFSAARSVLQDWNSAKIPYYTLPPVAPTSKSSTDDSESTIVTNWSKEFNIDEAFAAQETSMLDQIKTKGEMNTKFIQIASNEVEVDMDAVPDNSDMEDSEDMDSNSEDEMETISQDEMETNSEADADECPEAVPIYVTDLPVKQSKASTTQSTQRTIISEEEAALNPQKLNAQRKKQLKKQLKKMKSLKTKSTASMDDAYDFATDLLPAAMSDESD